MPIVSISKIQHRYGLSENLPQLSAAELGWSLDTRQLFIGNGPISEGAPTVGNTEILTEYSDILGLANGYTFKGTAAGYTVKTGVDINTPVVRTLQSKFDDFASVKDFGAKGDGVSDDTAAINRAFYELFARETNTEVRRSLFFPAGVYIVTDVIKIPSWAKVYGEGKNSTIIRQTTASTTVSLADNLQNIYPNHTVTPYAIEINDLSFENTVTNSTVADITSAVNCIFRRIAFKGSQGLAPSGVGTGVPASVKLRSTAALQARNILFEACDIQNNNFGAVADDDMQSILFNGCRFDNLYKGVKLGEDTSGSGSSVDGPKAVKITNSYFDNVYNAGIHVYNISGVVSAHNYFADVGNSLQGTGNPSSSVIIFETAGNASINDIFDRTDADNDTNTRIDLNGNSSYALNSADGVYFGYHKVESGKSIILTDNQSVATSSGLTFSATDEKTNLIYYTATRGNNVRHGVLKITASSSGSTLSDDFSEDGTDIGLILSISVSAGITTLNYTTTNTGNNVTFKYKVERLT